MLAGEGEAADGFAFEGVVGVQILARGIEIGMSHEVLDCDDVAAFLQKACGVGVSELVKCGVSDASALCESLESP